MMLKILILLSFIFQLHGGYYEHFFHQLMRENVKPVGWKMGLNAYFAGMSRRSIMQHFGAELDWHSDKRKDEYLSQSECPILPEQFDARNRWPNCKWIGFIRDQSNCGSCWIEAAFIYWQRSGLVTGGPYGEKACCLPYSISPCTMCRPYMLAPKCQRTCQASYNLSLKRDKYYGQFICGNKRCEEEENLTSWEVNFAYVEEQEKKNALLKLNLKRRKGTKLKRKLCMQKEKIMGLNPYFSGMSKEEILIRMGTKLMNSSTKFDSKLSNNNEALIKKLPKHFDSREKWPECEWIRFIRDQSNCGSCWAVSAASVMTDRHCIASKGQETPYISDEQILSCGMIPSPFHYWKKMGIATGGPYGDKSCCQPYSIAPCSKCTYTASTPSCKYDCQDDYDIPITSEHYHVPSNQYEIMNEIYTHGPVVAGFIVYEDFTYYISGIYHQTSYMAMGGHAIRIIGWGEENGIPYWLIANSWNTTFGEKGFFRIRRGTNECRIESEVYTGIPKLRLTL
ncbi:Cathepsin B-like cysteine proteinase 3 [Trichinella nelsoni]|uniref:Cathepsin B-like cysteine proteinase 3 n=1 Tax=Trichinella nelsoni TaxID=6336 RepID=A0A0V0RKZ9_9BILA|nr:Cathepsin B-like cysteine proteinase 3 [Trichinella nelsoni]